MIIPPGDGSGEVFRGPNISEPPRHAPLPADLRAGVAIKVGDQITTDHIIATGPVSRYRSNIPKSSDFLFQRVDPRFVERCKENTARGMASVIVAGVSYGQGSSREHAALCPAYLGVRAVIAKASSGSMRRTSSISGSCRLPLPIKGLRKDRGRR